MLHLCRPDFPSLRATYDLKNYHGLIERKSSLEDFKKIVNDLTGEPEICLNVKGEKYWIIKYKDYIL